MDLHIEYVGKGPRGGGLVSVAHYYEQNGDMMRDPDMVFEVDDKMEFWSPISYRQDGLGVYQEAVSQDEIGQVFLNPRLIKELSAFAKTWDRNLKEQGFC
jgi:hypothetical protein